MLQYGDDSAPVPIVHLTSKVLAPVDSCLPELHWYTKVLSSEVVGGGATVRLAFVMFGGSPHVCVITATSKYNQD